MSIPRELSRLEQVIVVSLTCDKCDKEIFRHDDIKSAAKYFYSKGWRVGGDMRIWCPDCREEET